MLKRNITYIDYNDQTVTEELYFNLTKAELAKLQVKMDGKYLDHLKYLIANQKVEGIFDFFYNLVLDAYGRRSEDGKKFYKTKEERDEFEASIAFSELLAELINDTPAMSAFSRAILPKDFQGIDVPPIEVVAGDAPALPAFD